jgi:RNA polymerase sigma-70 factor (ECF subfamily)
LKIPAIANSDSLLQTHQSLLARLKDHDDTQSWQDFFNTYWKLIYSFALRSGLNDSESQEVVQETIIEISRQMPAFKYDKTKGSFKNWLLKITDWRIKDQHRKRNRDAHLRSVEKSTEGTALIDSIPDPKDGNSIWDEEWERNLLEAALQKLKPKVRPRHYQIFDLYVVKNWPIDKVTATLAVNIGQVYLVGHRLTALLKKEIRSLESKF